MCALQDKATTGPEGSARRQGARGAGKTMVRLPRIGGSAAVAPYVVDKPDRKKMDKELSFESAMDAWASIDGASSKTKKQQSPSALEWKPSKLPETTAAPPAALPKRKPLSKLSSISDIADERKAGGVNAPAGDEQQSGTSAKGSTPLEPAVRWDNDKGPVESKKQGEITTSELIAITDELLKEDTKERSREGEGIKSMDITKSEVVAITEQLLQDVDESPRRERRPPTRRSSDQKDRSNRRSRMVSQSSSRSLCNTTPGTTTRKSSDPKERSSRRSRLVSQTSSRSLSPTPPSKSERQPPTLKASDDQQQKDRSTRRSRLATQTSCRSLSPASPSMSERQAAYRGYAVDTNDLYFRPRAALMQQGGESSSVTRGCRTERGRRTPIINVDPVEATGRGSRTERGKRTSVNEGNRTERGTRTTVHEHDELAIRESRIERGKRASVNEENRTEGGTRTTLNEHGESSASRACRTERGKRTSVKEGNRTERGRRTSVNEEGEPASREGRTERGKRTSVKEGNSTERGERTSLKDFLSSDPPSKNVAAASFAMTKQRSKRDLPGTRMARRASRRNLVSREERSQASSTKEETASVPCAHQQAKRHERESARRQRSHSLEPEKPSRKSKSSSRHPRHPLEFQTQEKRREKGASFSPDEQSQSGNTNAQTASVPCAEQQAKRAERHSCRRQRSRSLEPKPSSRKHKGSSSHPRRPPENLQRKSENDESSKRRHANDQSTSCDHRSRPSITSKSTHARSRSASPGKGKKEGGRVNNHDQSDLSRSEHVGRSRTVRTSDGSRVMDTREREMSDPSLRRSRSFDEWLPPLTSESATEPQNEGTDSDGCDTTKRTERVRPKSRARGARDELSRSEHVPSKRIPVARFGDSSSRPLRTISRLASSSTDDKTMRRQRSHSLDERPTKGSVASDKQAERAGPTEGTTLILMSPTEGKTKKTLTLGEAFARYPSTKQDVCSSEGSVRARRSCHLRNKDMEFEFMEGDHVAKLRQNVQRKQANNRSRGWLSVNGDYKNKKDDLSVSHHSAI